MGSSLSLPVSAVRPVLDSHVCDQIPLKINLEEKRFIFVHCFSPRLAAFIALDLC